MNTPSTEFKSSAIYACRRNSVLRNQLEVQTHFEERGWLLGSSHGRCWNNSYTKRFLDAAIALLILISIAPLMLTIALLIKTTSQGPILFSQYRTGYKGRRFRMYKFRTMVTNAEAMKAELAHLNQHSSSPDFKVKDDPRMTPIGKFLRKYSLDELPQLFNVVIGDMRLVGPRPTSFDITTYQSQHLRRLAAPPGLTGIWQVSGRSNIGFDERTVLDATYIQKQSPWQDLSILIRTPFAILKGDGAY
jgi:lipopolysaccharide/colanic/teichoic acid biosynthesis glycosyltransferase